MTAKKISFLIILFSFFFLASCVKKEDDPQTKAEKELREYLQKNNITVTPTASGLYFIDEVPGTGTAPVKGNYVMINVTGRLLNGNVIETNDSVLAAQKGILCLTASQRPYTYIVDSIGFAGVVEGILKMKEGGKARLILPYTLGLGIYGTALIPYYSNLVYDVELVKVIPDPVVYDSMLVKAIVDSGYLQAFSKPDTVYFLSYAGGTGDSIADGDTALIRYVRKSVDGHLLDANLGKGGITIVSSQYHPVGYLQTFRQMKKGATATVLIRYPYGYPQGLYGKAGELYYQQIIPSTTSVLFTVEVIDVYRKKK